MGNENDLNLDEEKLETALNAEVDKDKGEETPSEPTPEETPAEKTEEKPSEEEPSEDTPSLKSEEETPKEDTRFDKHPRWIERETKLKDTEQERDDASARVTELEGIEKKLEGLSPERLTQLVKAGTLLDKYPELSNKVNDLISNFDFEKTGHSSEVEELRQEVNELKSGTILDKYDREVDKLIGDSKVDKEIEPLVRELLDNRVANAKLTGVKEVAPLLEKVLKDVDLLQRKKLASRIVRKDPLVPASPKDKSKIQGKKESGEQEDVIEELAEGLKSANAPQKE